MQSRGLIMVVNKKTHKPCTNDIYIGRPSPLGNPFKMFTESMRDGVIGQYDNWLRLNRNNPTVTNILSTIKTKLRAGNEVHLVCWCAPLACHGDCISTLVTEMLDTEENK